MLRILVVDPDPDTAARIERLFGERHATRLELCGCTELDAAFGQMAVRPPAAVLLGSSLLPLDDEARLRKLLERFTPIPVVVIAEPEHARSAGRAVAAGAQDWVPKDAPLFLALARIVAYAIERAEAERRIARLERTARSAEALLVDVLESASRAALLVDADGRVQRCNAAAERLLYRPRTRIEGRPFADFLLKYDLARYRDAIHLAGARPGQNVVEEVRLVTGDETEPVRLEVRTCGPDEARRMHVLWLQPVQTAAGFEGDPEAQLRRLLQEVIASGRTRVPIAQVHLLGLDEVRKALGDRWPELEHRVHRVVERVLGSFLSPHERYCRNGDGGYIVVFARATNEEAAARAAAIAEAIEAAVLGADDLTARARSLVPPLGERERTALARVSAEVQEAAIDDPGLGRAAEPGSWLAGDWPMRPVEKDPVVELERQARERLRLDFEPVYDHAGLPTSMFLARPDGDGGSVLGQLLGLARSLPNALPVHDVCLLDATLAALEQEPGLEQMLVFAEVHYETLASRRFAEPYLARLRQIGPELQRSLALLIVGVAPGTYPPKLGRAVALVREFGRMRAVTLPDPAGEPPDPTVVRADLLVLDHAPAERMLRESPEVVRGFVRRAQMLQSRVLIRRVPRGFAPLLRERFGFDFTCHA